MQKDITIVGAGLVGSLCALYLTKRGHKITVFDRRKDLRSEIITVGKSINLALSKRGWTALEKVGVHKQVMDIAIAMDKRIMHDEKGNLTEQAYGKEGEAIYSVSRAELNVLMMKLAEKNGATLHFNEKCIDANLEESEVVFENAHTNEKKTISADVLIGADGAFSAVRKQMVAKHNHEYNYNEIEHDYKELLIPAGENGTHLLDKNALHIWPRGEFMLIALANLDGSFTCTLFAPKNGENSFDGLNAKEEVESYFASIFPDFTALVPNLYEQWNTNPTSSLGIVRTYPWHVNDASLLIGDAAHATVPFYGQGMNAGFEDCRILDELLDKHGDDLKSCFAEYSKTRKPNGDGVQDLSMQNFIVMRDSTASPDFLLQKQIEKKFANLYPEKWIPLYSMVSFTNISYSDAWEIGMKQEKIMEEIMKTKNIENEWKSDEIMQKMVSLV
ncbi:MAG: FAD-dependent monooxygenase [Flavobacteriales bacterium]|jgi:kynurenine 3-monooxygenase|nr:FAD-dependent monooxygenase [Flavobacteriales bacterium]MBT5750403.1 FAD-dependent monooxygenase [Flavobacteriales bacterium]